MDIKRLDGESDFEFHKRLIEGKLVDRTLSDVDYSELAELVYGRPYASDVARRMMYGSQRTLALMEEENISKISDNKIISEIDEKTMELFRERQKLNDQKRMWNGKQRKIAREENLHDALIAAAKNIPATVGLPIIRAEAISDKYRNAIDSKNNTEAVLVLCDWHFGMVTDNVFNTYNTSICFERVNAVVNNVIDRMLLHSVNKLHVMLLGDFIHGAIHISTRVESEELVCDQLMRVSEILAQAINKLSIYVPELYVYSTYGNHARTVSKKEDSEHEDNMEKIIPWWLKARLSNNERVHIVPSEDNEFVFVSPFNAHPIVAVHGDLDNLKKSPRILSTLFRKKYDLDIECVIMGDKHHRESYEELGITTMISGALCGSDNYASEHRLFSTPSQLLLIFREEGLDAEYYIRCQNDKPHANS